MRYIFNFPDIGEGLDEGTILEWYVDKGHTVKAGEPLVKVETDKVVADIPSPKTGTVVSRYGKVGETIHVGAALVEIELEGVFAEAAVAEAQSDTTVELQEEGSAGVVGTIEVAGKNAFLPASEEGVVKNAAAPPPTEKVLSTPVARALAKDLGIDIRSVQGTGPGGRITKEDVNSFNMRRPAAVTSESPGKVPYDGDVEYQPLTQIRKTIARNMINSKQNAAHMSVFEEVEISDLVWLKEKYQKGYAEQNIKLTYLPFIIKATVNALRLHPQLNSEMDTENSRMVYKHYYNIGIAVDTPEGLVVPVIKNVDRLSVPQIAQKIAELSQKAKERKLTLDEMKDGTFTITNYGSIGGIYGTPVINYPQAGILGVGRVLSTPVVKDDQIVIGRVLPLSLSVDHRIVDGGEASRFLKGIMDSLSDPFSLMI